MDIAQLIWINTIVLVGIVMLVLVFLFGIPRELRKTAETVGRVEDTARDIARFLAEKLA
jgi:Sec-independent protein translocase protein TatA